MSTPFNHEPTEVAVEVNADELLELAGEATDAIVIPVAGLPPGSTLTLTITVGVLPAAPAPEPAPERQRPMMGTNRR